MSPATFISDSDLAVDQLVHACNKPRASLEEPVLPHLIGRELQPYDFGDTANPLDAAPSGKQTKRKGSPQHAQGRPRSSGACSPTNGKHPKKASATPMAEAEAHNTPSRNNNNASTHAPVRQPKAASPARSAPSLPTIVKACPGTFRNSPKAETLPLPSSALLMRAACLHVAAPPRLAVVA